MARVQTMVQLTVELLVELDAEAHRRQLSRSALIREAVEAQLSASRDQRIGDLIVDGYRRVPPETPDEWGDLGAAGDTSVAEVSLRLDAEERRAGMGPW